MSPFWSWWVGILTTIFLIIMVVVVWYFWRERKSENYEHVRDCQDGIEDRDGPVPVIFYWAYWIGFPAAAVFFLLYPGYGNWKGLMDWEYEFHGEPGFVSIINEKVDSMKGPGGTVTLAKLSQDEQVYSAGKSIFDTHCIQCHRADGQGQLNFPNLTDNYWIFGGTDADILHSIRDGREGAMPGWKDVLTTEEIDNVIWYILSRNPERRLSTTWENVDLGKAVYMEHCAECHAADGTGDKKTGALDLVDDIWLYGGGRDQIRRNIEIGVYGVMPAWKDRLSEGEIYSVAAYIIAEQKRVQDHVASLDPKLIERGYYLSRIGDCMACHTEPGGENFGGGLGFDTPFGTMFSRNISPSPDEGIGSWTYEDFYDALHSGEGKTWYGFLYPAMPYTSYQYITDEDTRAIWAYIQSVPPVSQKNKDNTVIFPANIRLGMLAWDIMFMRGSPLQFLKGIPELDYPEDRSESWKRGKYLVKGLGHCEACHTPRNIGMAMELDRPLQGALIDGWDAPDITATELYRTGWTVEELTQLFKHGHSGKGSVFGGMADVIKNSLRYATIDDLNAIAEYLITGDVNNVLDKSVEVLKPTGFDNDAYANEQYKFYSYTCGACHGLDGEGRENIAPTLLNNGIIMHDDPYDTIAVVIRGIQPDYRTLDTTFMPMISFKELYSDAELALLITFVRKYLGGRSDEVTAEQVTKIRKTLKSQGYTESIHEPNKDIPTGDYNTGDY